MSEVKIVVTLKVTERGHESTSKDLVMLFFQSGAGCMGMLTLWKFNSVHLWVIYIFVLCYTLE